MQKAKGATAPGIHSRGYPTKELGFFKEIFEMITVNSFEETNLINVADLYSI